MLCVSINLVLIGYYILKERDRRGGDRMVVRFTTTCVIIA